MLCKKIQEQRKQQASKRLKSMIALLHLDIAKHVMELLLAKCNVSLNVID